MLIEGIRGGGKTALVEPRDGSDSVIRGVLAYHQATGGFPKNFVEVEETVWKHKKPPNFGDTGRAFNAYNYNYIFFRLGAHECAIYAIPGGGRRAEAPSFYFYVTTHAVWKWKGPALSEEDVAKLRPVRPGTEESLLLGVLGMTEQPKSAIKMEDTVRKASIVKFRQKYPALIQFAGLINSRRPQASSPSR
jgi:hypothetical protein